MQQLLRPAPDPKDVRVLPASLNHLIAGFAEPTVCDANFRC